MEFRTRLESNLVSESEAYGYTLCIWGAGALLIDAFGVPGFGRVLAYVAGALGGFGLLAVLTFRGIAEEAAAESPSSLVASMIHIVSTGGTICIVQAFLAANGTANAAFAFFAVGLLVTVAYNLLLLLEELTTTAAL